MPLLKGNSKEVIKRNIEMLIKEGKKPNEAIAIALKEAGKASDNALEHEFQRMFSDMENESADFEKVHLFNAGTFNGISNKPEHLRSMVEFAKDHPNIYADLKLDHIDDKKSRDTKFKIFENFPYVLATIKNLSVNADGTKLFGDYVKVFEPVKNALKDKLLRTHSAEIFYNVTSRKTGKKYPAVLGAVAILPAGKMPALMEVFKPYMYRLNGISDAITFENKLVCNFEKENYSMSEQDYEIKMKKYRDKGMTCKSFSEFMKMDEEGKTKYMDMMEDEYQNKMKSENEKKEGLMPAKNEASAEVTKGEFSLDQIKAEMDAIREMKANYESAISEMKDQFKKDAEHYKAEYEALQTARKQDQVNAFVDGLIKSETPKLLPAQREKAVFALMSLDNSKKVNYSIDGKEVEKSSFELVSELLKSLPEIKQVYSEKPVVKGDGELAVYENELIAGEDVDAALADKKVKQKYSDKDFENMTEAEIEKIYKAEGLI